MPDVQKINEAVDQLIRSLNQFKQSLVENSNDSTPIIQEFQAQSSNSVEDVSSFESLKKALMTDKWPEAVNPNLICQPDNENDKIDRGRGIIELMIEEDLKGLRFLDFGCGEGHCVYVGAEYEPELAVGYDVKHSESWERFQKENTIFTTEFETVVANGPYDVIILFDVLDHVKGEDAVSLLSKAQSLLSDNGKIYMRCHPFISKHGTHLYHELNKAYVHLVFNEEEIKDIIPQSKYAEESIGVIYPIKTYAQYIEEAGLKIITRRDITSKVEPFFKIPKIAERIILNTKTNVFPEFQMSQEFLDYVLKK